ncbi:MAG: dUTP diphosphatase [Candidatus Kapabacteria bacterium]|nr:dUTP diphosphatase [Candidatus Kapabacteria bacterium]MCS7170190.1 dUTP diphosphatase [Candidatus Kapabacteria bacterium]MDW7996637.1 dUTP diphosphatase [Bacteroidota bacterium]MDW8226024.1 dUTP diphosphatase [Bacteroidota bacterium]
MLVVQIQRTDPAFADLPLPTYATEGSAGMDVYAAVTEPVELPPGGIVVIPTGIAIALPPGYECQVRSRSGIAARYGVFALNAPGTIDSDFRGEIRIILANFGREPFWIRRGDRIAQLVVTRYERVCWELVPELPRTERGSGGFGSTGIGDQLR